MWFGDVYINDELVHNDIKILISDDVAYDENIYLNKDETGKMLDHLQHLYDKMEDR